MTLRKCHSTVDLSWPQSSNYGLGSPLWDLYLAPVGDFFGGFLSGLFSPVGELFSGVVDLGLAGLWGLGLLSEGDVVGTRDFLHQAVDDVGAYLRHHVDSLLRVAAGAFDVVTGVAFGWTGVGGAGRHRDRPDLHGAG
jgi:hypothetical protein